MFFHFLVRTKVESNKSKKKAIKSKFLSKINFLFNNIQKHQRKK